MSVPFLLGIDCGSTMVKAAIFDSLGNEHAVASEKVPHIYLKPDWTENDAENLWEIVCRVVARTLQTGKIDPAQIASVTCTGYGNGLYLTDEHGHPTRNGIISSDARAREFIDQWTRDGLPDKILHKTMQSIWAAQPNALLRWLMIHEPESIDRATWLFSCKDYIRFRMTDVPCFEVSDATGTSLLDVGTGQCDDEVLETWGISSCRRLIPPIVRSSDLCGSVTEEAARLTGLRPGTPVVAGMFDIDACALAVGMTDPARLCMVAGTWGNNLSLSPEPVVSKDVFMTSRFCIDGYYLMLEGSPTSASNFDWFVTQFYQNNRKNFAETTAPNDPVDIYQYCLDLIAKTEPEDSPLVFLPYLYGSPVDLDGKGVLFGLDGRQTQGQVLRAVLEGAVFGHRWHVERLLQFRTMPQTIRLTGGATKSPLWTQIFADVFQVPVEVPAGTELGILGAVICGAVAVGIHSDYHTAVEKMVRIDRIYQPDPALAALYEKKYHRFKNLLSVFNGHWSLLKNG